MIALLRTCRPRQSLPVVGRGVVGNALVNLTLGLICFHGFLPVGSRANSLELALTFACSLSFFFSNYKLKMTFTLVVRYYANFKLITRNLHSRDYIEGLGYGTNVVE